MENRAECIAFENYKGGTGKTTSCISIAGYLAHEGKKVLVIDFDPQANATSGLGVDSLTLKRSIYDAVLYFCEVPSGVPINDIILETGFQNIHLAPSEFDLSVAEVVLNQTKDRIYLLDSLLDEIRNHYDYILIDLPSSPGILSLNGLCASGHLMIPLDPCIYSLEALDNLKTTFHNIRSLAEHFIERITAILIKYSQPGIFRRHNPSQEIEKELRGMFDTVFVIPEDRNIYEAQKAGAPISHFAPDSKAGKAYEKIAKNIISE